MAHYFRHILLSYKSCGKNLHEMITASRRLSALEAGLMKMQGINPQNPKVQALLERVRRIKTGLS